MAALVCARVSGPLGHRDLPRRCVGGFGLGYVGAVVFVAVGLAAPVPTVLLILAAGARLSSYVGGTMGEIGFLRGIWLDGSRRLIWLEDYVAALGADADVAPPARLGDGIRLRGVDFAYPGSDRLALDDINLHLPPGSVVAVVGENGAGKSTLVKLLAKMYEPTRGEILIDFAPLRRMPAAGLAGPAGRCLPGLLPV